jgi:glucose-6-phosphate 1-dehydrogenase
VLPFTKTDTETLGANQLVVRVQPDEGVTLRFGSKVPGTTMEVRDVAMDFQYGEAFTEASPEAYERLLLDVLLGDASLFPRNEEVEESWRVIDPIEHFWAEQDARRRAAPVPRRRVGAQGRRGDARPRRPRLAPAVTAAAREAR